MHLLYLQFLHKSHKLFFNNSTFSSSNFLKTILTIED